MTDEDLISILCKDDVFRSSIEKDESKKVDEISANWEDRRLEIFFENGDLITFDLDWIVDNLRKSGYEKEFLN